MSDSFTFLKFDGSAWPWWCALAALGAGLCIVLFWKAERGVVSPAIGRALLTLRLLVVVLVLFLLWQPVWQTLAKTDRKGTIALAVDVSASMRLADELATSAEKQRWAQAVHGVSMDHTTSASADWQQSLVEGVARLTRLEQIGQLLSAPMRSTESTTPKESNAGPTFWQTLSQSAHVQPLLFAGEGQLIDDVSFPQSLSKPAIDNGLNVEQTRLAAAMDPDDLLNPAETEPLRAIILFSDGCDTSPAGKDVAVKLARQWGERKVPIYPVLVGSEQSTAIASIAAFDYPDWIRSGREALLNIRLRHPPGRSESEAGTVDLVVTPEVGEPFRRTVTVQGDQTEVNWLLPAREQGTQKYTLFLDTAEKGDKDEIDVNPSQATSQQIPFVIRVVEDKTRVLMLEREARWEFRFTHSVWERDLQTEVQAVLFRQPDLGLLDRNFFPRDLTELNPADSQKPFADYDLIVVGDLSTENMPDAIWQQLGKYMADDGGTVLFLAGPDFASQVERSPAMQKLLPVAELQPIVVHSQPGLSAAESPGFHLLLTTAGQSEAAFQLAADVKQNWTIWSALPELHSGWTAQPLPGATLLATAETGQSTQAAESNNGQPVIVHRFYGLGQVIWQGVDSTWRWRRRESEPYHRRYWQQMAEWASRHKASAQNSVTRIELDRYQIEAGESVTVHVYPATSPAQPATEPANETFSLHIFAAGNSQLAEPVQVLPLKPTDPNQRELTANVDNLPAGNYRLYLANDSQNQLVPDLFTQLSVQSKLSDERQNRRADAQTLTQLAQASGGQLYYPDQLSELSAALQLSSTVDNTTSRFALWNHWSPMLLLFVLLTAEWTLRKRNGLP